MATLTFMMPKTGHLRHRSYPFHRSVGNIVTKYLVLKTKRLLNQVVSSGKKAVFVMPVPNPAGYFGALDQARALWRYLQEVVFCLRTIKSRTSEPPDHSVHDADARAGHVGTAMNRRAVVGLCTMTLFACDARKGATDASERSATTTAPAATATVSAAPQPAPQPVERVRLITPSAGVVTSSRVVFRWAAEGAGQVEMSRTRTFDAMAHTAHTERGRHEATVSAIANGRWFWRIKLADGTTSSARRLRVIARNPRAVKQSWVVGTDYNGDGLADLTFPGAIYLGRARHAPSFVVVSDASDAVAAGDINGDGFDDLIARRGSAGLAVFLGSAALRDSWSSAFSACPEAGGCTGWHSTIPLGDINGDGYADVCSQEGHVFCGARGGLSRCGRALAGYTSIAGGGDIDGDGFHDAVGVRPDGSACLHRGGADGLRAQAAVCHPLGTDAREGALPRVALADLDGDGLADVVGSTVIDRLQAAGELRLLRGTSDLASVVVTSTLRWSLPNPRPNRRFTLHWTVDPRAGSPAARILVVDDASPSQELFEVTLAGGRLTAKSTTRLNSYAEERRPAAVGDVDGDGIDDLVTHYTTSLEGTWSQLLRFGARGVLDVLEGRELDFQAQDRNPIPTVIPRSKADRIELDRSAGWD